MSDCPLLVPLTKQAKKALEERTQVEINHLPFRIGRESRAGLMDGRRFYLERRGEVMSPNNDLYLADAGTRLHVSREHLQIDVTSDGEIRVYDFGSSCGTHVDGKSIGGRNGPGSLALKDDSEIVIGTPSSPYRFAIKHLERIHDIHNQIAATGLS